MGIFNKIIHPVNTINDLVNSKAFNSQSNVHNYTVNAGKIYHIKALETSENNQFIFYTCFSEYKLKSKDRIISESDKNYFVKDVFLDVPYTIQQDGAKDLVIKVQKIICTEDPLQLHDYINQISKITSNITINADNSNFGDVGKFITTQNIEFNKVLKDLETAIEYSYNVDKLRHEINEIKEHLKLNKPLKTDKIKKVFQSVGAAIFDLAKTFLTAYLSSKAT